MGTDVLELEMDIFAKIVPICRWENSKSSLTAYQLRLDWTWHGTDSNHSHKHEEVSIVARLYLYYRDDQKSLRMIPFCRP